MSQRFDLYVPRDSWLHRLDPRTKLWIVLLACTTALIYKHIVVLAGLLILAHLALSSAQIPGDRTVTLPALHSSHDLANIHY